MEPAASTPRHTAAAKRRMTGALGVLLSALALSACTSESMTGPAVAPMTPALPPITSDELVGKWGLGSFRDEKDLARTTSEARRFCNNPYVITKGPGGGVMMYLADQSSPTEVVVRTVSGRVYIGPPGQPPGGIKDRQVMSFENGVLVAAWVDPSVAARYGTMVFVKCPDGSKPASTATAQ